MENLLSSATSHEVLPYSFVFPPEEHLPASAATIALPIIDLARPRDKVRRAVLEAGKELGFFQVANHGVPEEAVRDMEVCCKEFFRLPAADKAAFYSEDTDRPNRLFSSTTYGIGGERYWRDCLRFACSFPVAAATRNEWTSKPSRLRPAVERFVDAGRRDGAAAAAVRGRGDGAAAADSLSTNH